MASNLSSIGFAFSGAEEFQAAMLRLAPDSTLRVTCGVGDYSIWHSATGAEIWFHLPPFGTEDDARDIAGLTPFFEGASDVALRIDERITHPEDDNAFEGAFLATVVPVAPALDDDLMPLVFVAVDFAVHADKPLPLACRARIVGFARTVRAFAGEAEYMAAATARGGLRMAARSFVPIGQFEEGPPTAEALLTGRVVEHEELVNEENGQPFHWMLVDTLGVRLDIVADPEAVAGNLAEGCTVEVGCILFGRLLA